MVNASPMNKAGHNGNTEANSHIQSTYKSYEHINKSNSNSKIYLDNELLSKEET